MRSGSAPEPRPRLHLDLFTDSAEEQQAEVRRLTCLGARVDGWDLDPDDPDFVVMADPGSNVFRVVDLSHAPSGGPSRSRTDGLPERGLRREE